MNNQAEKLGVKIKSGLQTLKKHWKTPPDGYYVSYKELLNHSLGQGALSFAAILMSCTLVSITVPMMIGYFKVSSGFVFIGGLIASLIGMLRAPILAMIIDNSNSKKGKFKPFIPFSAVAMTVCFSIVPFIPESLIDTHWFSISLPSIPILDVVKSTVDVSVGVALMFVLVQAATFFHTLLTQCMVGIEQTISPVSQERANVTAFRSILSNLPGSIVNVIIPIVAGLVFGQSDNPMNRIELYRWALPICGMGCVAFTFFEYYGVKERTILEKDHVAKITFKDGFKELFLNKYFWIILIYTVLVGIRGSINFTLWICNYAVGGEKGAYIFAICQVVLNNAFVPGMLLGPFMVKKLGKRNVMFFSTVGFAVVALIQLILVEHPYLLLVCIFFQNFFAGFGYISNVMVPDILDYQQWKTGKRLEGFWQNLNSFFMTFFGIVTSVLVPLVLYFAGIGFGDNIDVALKNHNLMFGAFRNIAWLVLVSAVLSIIPFFFYDLSEKQHAKYIKALKIRAIVKDYNNNKISDQEAKSLRKIVDEAKEQDNKFILEELKNHKCIDDILKINVSQ